MKALKKLFSVKVSYTLVFLSLVTWAFIAYFTMNELILSQKSYGKLINLSGKQRMLSQKTALMSTRIILDENNKKLIKHLQELLHLMQQDHKFIVNNLTSEHMENIYFNEPYNLDIKVKKYFSILEQFLQNTQDKNTLESISNYSFHLLPELNYAVYEFEKESETIVEQLQHRETFILIGTLLTLLLELIFIVLPTIKMAKESQDTLENYNKNLQQEVEEKTKLIQAEQELLKFYLNNVNSVILELDADANIKMINKTGCEILGYEEKELIGKNWFKLNIIPKNEIKLLKNYFKDIISDKVELSSSSFESELIDTSGNKKTLTWSNVLLKKENNITGLLSSGIDITHEKEQENILYEQAKMAALGEMISNIAHQWRQPLSLISTAATGSIMEKEIGALDDSKLIKRLQTIDEHAQYLSETIDTFRSFLLEKKEYKEVVLQERIAKALEIVSTSLKNHYIKVIDNTNDVSPIKINLVVGELSQVIINILNNAKDAISSNNIQDPWVKLDLEKKKKKLVITIEDNGGGIPKDVLPRIFEPYFTTKHKSQGTGLGLHMSYKIITDSLNGKLYAKNTDNGAKFFIELPYS